MSGTGELDTRFQGIDSRRFLLNRDAVTFVGDLYAPTAFHSQLPLGSPWVCILEGPITTAHAGTTGKINLKAEGLNLAESIGSLPAALSLANNHVLDYGDAGMRDTLRLLESSGIRAFGFRSAAGSGRALAHVRCSGIIGILESIL